MVLDSGLLDQYPLAFAVSRGGERGSNAEPAVGGSPNPTFGPKPAGEPGAKPGDQGTCTCGEPGMGAIADEAALEREVSMSPPSVMVADLL